MVTSARVSLAEQSQRLQQLQAADVVIHGGSMVRAAPRLGRMPFLRSNQDASVRYIGERS